MIVALPWCYNGVLVTVALSWRSIDSGVAVAHNVNIIIFQSPYGCPTAGFKHGVLVTVVVKRGVGVHCSEKFHVSLLKPMPCILSRNIEDSKMRLNNYVVLQQHFRNIFSDMRLQWLQHFT